MDDGKIEGRRCEDGSDIYLIDFKTYRMVMSDNNSAPCSKCAFYNAVRYGNCCDFPKDRYVRLCKHDRGSHNGWKCIEYERV